MSKLTGELIKAGLSVFTVGYDRQNHKPTPMEVTIVTGEVEREGGSNVLWVTVAPNQDHMFGVSTDPFCEDGRKVIYLGDDGIRPYNYDDRCTQVFTTKEECQALIDMLNGRYPTLVDENGNDKKRFTEYMDDMWPEDDYMDDDR